MTVPAARHRAFGPLLLALCVIGTPLAAQTPVAGTWNLETRNIAMRATGGVRNVLLRIEETNGALSAQMTSPRNNFLDVTDFRLDGSRMRVRFGAYLYVLEVDGDRLTGTMTSPVDTLHVDGTRQQGLMYGGDEPEQYVATRSGFLGHRTYLAPPRDEADPVGWVRSRIDSVEDVALILRGIPVRFTNAPDFESQLTAYAGRRVDVTGEWVGERYRIHEIALAESR